MTDKPTTDVKPPDYVSHIMGECGERLTEAVEASQTVVILVGDAFRLRVYNSAGNNHDAALDLLKKAQLALRSAG